MHYLARLAIFVIITAIVTPLVHAVSAESAAFFENSVRPLLVEHCEGCHGQKKQWAGLRLDSGESVLKGGESGPVLVPGNADASELIRRVASTDDDIRMPPPESGVKLSDSEIAALASWIRNGAEWPATDPETGGPRGIRAGGVTDSDRDHWSFRSLSHVLPSKLPDDSWSHNAVDYFVLSAQRRAGLAPNVDASKAALLRRLALDLTGLLPSLAEQEAFLADESADAVEKVVEGLLRSPAYGERWGRHWLDLVRYADTSGVASDHPVPQARRYRDYVINAFNQDKPYDQFVREQIAGDLIAADHLDEPNKYAELITATGYVAISRRFGFEPNEDQHLTIQDTLDNIGQTFLGLSIGCARCHDHKFEPITARDYYSLYGIFDSTRYPFTGAETDQIPKDFTPLLAPEEAKPLQDAFEAKMAEIAAKLVALAEEKKVLPAGEIPSVDWKERQQAAEAQRNQLQDAGPYQTAYAVSEGVAHNSRIQKRGEPASPGDEVSRRYLEVLGGSEVPGATAMAEGYYVDGWYVAELSEPVQLEVGREYTVSVNVNTHYVRSPEAEVVPVPSGPLAFQRGVYSEPGKYPTEQYGFYYFADVLFDTHTESTGRNWPLLMNQKPQILNRNDNKPYEVGTVFTASVPGQVRALRFIKAANEVGSHVAKLWNSDGQLLASATFASPSGASGRRELGDWLISANPSLAARVMVNRVWQHHFGYGLVRSENDFGHQGEAPSHPGLLDFLSEQFIASGWSVKALHRLILASHAYRLSSSDVPASSAIDPENRKLWRFPRQRMDAEAIRDNLLLLAGSLDLSIPNEHPFPPQRSWNFTQHNPFLAVYEHNHRSVYLMTQRFKRNPLYVTFDGPDPNASTPRRMTTTVPSQALFMMNSSFVQKQSEAFAKKIISGNPDFNSRLKQLFREALVRDPSVRQQTAVAGFIEHYQQRFESSGVPLDQRELKTWSAVAQQILASNEFLYGE